MNRTITLCLALSLGATLTSDAEEAFVHAGTGISLPAVLGGFARGQVQTYEAAPGEAGVAIPFHGDAAEITVFIRATKPGVQNTAQGIVDESLTVTKELEKAGTYTNVKVFQGQPDAENPQWSRGAYTARADGQLIISFMYGTVKSSHTIKVRITITDPKDESFASFIKELQKVVNTATPKGQG